MNPGHMAGGRQKRPWLAALLALVYPGLGHLYLRAWLRALLWFGLIMSAVVVLVPDLSSAGAGGPMATAEAAWDATRALPLRTQALLTGMMVLEAFDAFVLARRTGTAERGDDADAVGTCPNCGRELDEDLDFCPWCSTRLEE